MAAEAFRLMVRNPYLPDDYFRMKIEPTANVRDLKTLLFKHYHEHPEVGDQRLISGGKMLEDGERMKDLFTHEVDDEGLPADNIVHITVKTKLGKSYWTTSRSRSESELVAVPEGSPILTPSRSQSEIDTRGGPSAGAVSHPGAASHVMLAPSPQLLPQMSPSLAPSTPMNTPIATRLPLTGTPNSMPPLLPWSPQVLQHGGSPSLVPRSPHVMPRMTPLPSPALHAQQHSQLPPAFTTFPASPATGTPDALAHQQQHAAWAHYQQQQQAWAYYQYCYYYQQYQAQHGGSSLASPSPSFQTSTPAADATPTPPSPYQPTLYDTGLRYRMRASTPSSASSQSSAAPSSQSSAAPSSQSAQSQSSASLHSPAPTVPTAPLAPAHPQALVHPTPEQPQPRFQPPPLQPPQLQPPQLQPLPQFQQPDAALPGLVPADRYGTLKLVLKVIMFVLLFSSDGGTEHVFMLMGFALVAYVYQAGWFQGLNQLAEYIPPVDPAVDQEELEEQAIERELFGEEGEGEDEEGDVGDIDGVGVDGGEGAFELDGHEMQVQHRGGTLYNVERFIVALFASLLPGRYEFERV